MQSSLTRRNIFCPAHLLFAYFLSFFTFLRPYFLFWCFVFFGFLADCSSAYSLHLSPSVRSLPLILRPEHFSNYFELTMSIKLFFGILFFDVVFTVILYELNGWNDGVATIFSWFCKTLHWADGATRSGTKWSKLCCGCQLFWFNTMIR